MTTEKHAVKPRVLVTGASGLLGRHVVRKLRSEGVEVRGLDLRRSEEDIDWHVGDICDAEVVRRATEGCSAVMHIAARPNIWSGDEDDILRINTMGTWNLYQAVERCGIRRVVFCSSDSVMGYTVREGKMIPPDYVPVDVDHPLRATDAYALSKILGEDIARSFAWRGIETVALRTVFVAYPEMEGEIRARAANPDTYTGRMAGGPSSAGGGPLHNYVDPRDLASAFWSALNMPDPGTRDCPFEAIYIANPETLSSEPTLDRLMRLAGDRVEVRDAELYRRNPFACLYDLAPAYERLGYRPEHSLRHLID